MDARQLFRNLGVIWCLGCCGCLNPFNTRFPTVGTAPPPVEARSYTLHDPFPDEDVGPDTMTRPRGFEEPRAEPRKTLEGRALLGLEPVPNSTIPPSSFNYPNTVRQ